MKICVVHNFYQSSSPSGEDEVFRNEVELLKKNHIDVVTYKKNNDDIATSADSLRTAFETVWSRKTYKELKALLKRERPDIVHFHNVWYLISPSAYSACKDAGVPVIQTLHNFRLFCVNALLMRNGKTCEECVGKFSWRGAVYGCYRESRLHSIPIAFAESFHKLIGTWNDKIDAFIALTEFGKKKFVECGLPEEKIFVKPNFLSNPPEPFFEKVIPPSPLLQKGGRGDFKGYAVFLGRLSHEKGVAVLIDAMKCYNADNTNRLTLKIIGDGPLRGQLEEKVKSEKIDNIEFTGKKKFNECMKLLARAQFMVMPAICYENFPMAIREAFACGKPVIASNLGAMAELVQDGKTGLLFKPGNLKDLAEKMKWMVEHENDCIEMGENARRVFEQKYTAEKNFDILIGIYNKTTQKPTPPRCK